MQIPTFKTWESYQKWENNNFRANTIANYTVGSLSLPYTYTLSRLASTSSKWLTYSANLPRPRKLIQVYRKYKGKLGKTKCQGKVLIPDLRTQQLLLVRQRDTTHGLPSSKEDKKKTTVVVFSFLHHQLLSHQLINQANGALLFCCCARRRRIFHATN